MDPFPSLTSLLQVLGSVGAVIGACVAFFLPAEGGRQMAENVVLGGALGGIIGAIVAFAVYAGILAGGGA